MKSALRQLTKSTGFSVTVLLTLALGIGACTAIFTVVNSVLLRPVNFPESERLMIIRETALPQFPQFSVAPANYRSWTEQADTFESLALTRQMHYNLTGDGDPVRVIALRTSGNYFSTLRVAPALGRAYGSAEDEPGKATVVVLTHAFWQKQFGGRTDILDTTIRLNGVAHTVIGIMPADYMRGSRFEVLTPLALTPEQWQNRGGHSYGVTGRLKPGVTPAQAQTQMTTIANRLAEQFPDTNKGWGALVIPILDFNTGNLKPTFYTLLGAVFLLLLIACANVANLLLARAAGRQREISVRAALGAGRGRLICQLLAESLLFSLLGGALGLVLAKWGLDALLAIAPADLPRAAEISLDARAFAFTFAIALLTGLIFGLVPAWQGSRVNLVDALKEGSRGSSEGGRHLFRSGLVVAEVAFALMLLTGAGLLIRSFDRLAHANPGFNPENAMMLNLSLPVEKYDTEAKQLAFTEAAVARMAALPGVTAVGTTHSMPFSGNDYILGLELPGRDPAQELPSTAYFAVTPGYFKAMGIPLIRGRLFDAHDTGQAPVAIISQAFAEKIFPGEDPIGKRVHMTNGPTKWREIVGIVGEIKNARFDQETAPQSYEPVAQQPFAQITFVIRTDGATAGIPAALRRCVQAVDPDQPVFLLESLDQLIASSIARQRFAATLMVIFSLLALILAAIGIYGVVSYTVAQRTNEFGIRLALGATAGNVIQLVMRRSLAVAGLGLLLGVICALALANLVQSLLYGVDARDPLTFLVIPPVLALVAALACYLPARRATKVDPLAALRAE